MENEPFYYLVELWTYDSRNLCSKKRFIFQAALWAPMRHGGFNTFNCNIKSNREFGAKFLQVRFNFRIVKYCWEYNLEYFGWVALFLPIFKIQEIKLSKPCKNLTTNVKTHLIEIVFTNTKVSMWKTFITRDFFFVVLPLLQRN